MKKHSFGVFWPFKNVKTILSLQALQKHMTGLDLAQGPEFADPWLRWISLVRGSGACRREGFSRPRDPRLCLASVEVDVSMFLCLSPSLLGPDLRPAC